MGMDAERLAAGFRGGVAIVVATVGSDGQPAITRGWGPRFDTDHGELTICVTAPAGSRTSANLTSNGAVAITASQPLTYQTVQVKGHVDHVDAPSEADRSEAHAHLGRFVAEVAQIGVIEGADNLYLGDLRTITVAIAETYEQSPGAAAGTPLR